MINLLKMLGCALLWFFGMLFLLIGISNVFSSLIYFFMLSVVGLLLIPSSYNFISKKINIESNVVRTLLIILVNIIFFPNFV